MRKTCLGWTPACPFAWLRSRAFLPRSNWLSLEKPASFILSINWCILAGIAQLCCLSFGNTIMWDEKCRCATCCISPVTRLRFPEVRPFIFFFLLSVYLLQERGTVASVGGKRGWIVCSSLRWDRECCFLWQTFDGPGACARWYVSLYLLGRTSVKRHFHGS